MTISRDRRKKNKKRELQEDERGQRRLAFMRHRNATMHQRSFAHMRERKGWATKTELAKKDYDAAVLQAKNEYYESSGYLAPSRKQRRR